MVDAPHWSNRAVFLDRDGVLNENRPDYVKSIDEVALIESAPSAVAALNQAGFLTIVVSNQSAVGRGVASRVQIDKVQNYIVAEFSKRGAPLIDAYLCPHAPEAGCSCRKPEPGLLLQAAEEHGINLSRSFLVGDAVTDVEAALAVGATPFMVRSGRGFDQEPLLRELGYLDVPVFDDLASAAEHILRGESRR